MASDILVVDDEEDIREIVSGILSDEGHETRTAFDSDSALAAISDRAPRLIFLDIWMQGSKLDGLSLLDEIKARHPELPVVMISGHGNIETAVSAIKRGAFDFIEKPFKADRLILIAERALENSKLKREVSELKRRTGDAVELIGTSVAVSQLRQTIDKVSPTNSRVMIFGPSGSGKELVARMIHKKSARANGPFVALNAATITPERMEIALFGTEGAPASAAQDRRAGGRRIAASSISMRSVRCRARRRTRSCACWSISSSSASAARSEVKVDVRIISSTAYNLESRIAESLFREDLYHRLAVVPVRVPALAERREDIPFLVDQLMRQISEQAGIRSRRIGDDAMAVLQAHDWPGNIRQLRNNIERLMILARTDGPDTPITAEMLPTDLGDMLPKVSAKNDYHIMTLPLREAREMFERDYLIAQINRFGGNISRTAEFVGMERSALHRKLKSLGV